VDLALRGPPRYHPRMTSDAVAAVTWLVVLAGLIVLVWRAGKRRRGRRVGAGAYGAVYDMLNADKRNAIEIIVEQRAEARDPEDADGNLPDLATGVKHRR
jgi:hypothetical protein